MNLTAEQKQKWVDALRSGEYKQGTGQLKLDDSYCCLGVFCVVNGLQLCENGMSIVVDDKKFGYRLLDEMLGTDNVGTLWYMNDTQNKSFLEIADYIDKTYATNN